MSWNRIRTCTGNINKSLCHYDGILHHLCTMETLFTPCRLLKARGAFFSILRAIFVCFMQVVETYRDVNKRTFVIFFFKENLSQLWKIINHPSESYYIYCWVFTLVSVFDLGLELKKALNMTELIGGVFFLIQEWKKTPSKTNLDCSNNK